MVIPISAAGKDGEAATGQTFKGSPLRILDSWESGKKYYDGKRDAENGVFYQDVVLYNNMYYACINTEAGESDQWKLNLVQHRTGKYLQLQKILQLIK